MNIICFPKDIANKILNNINEIKISERKKIWKHIHTELFKGYILEETGKLVVFKSGSIILTWSIEYFKNLKNKWPDICNDIIKQSKIEPNNYLNFNESHISEEELKDIDYHWIIRIPKLVPY